jgi:phage virion morphogenesis protein
MAGAFVEVEFDAREIEKALRNLLKKTGDLQPAFRDIGEYLLRSHDERFRAGIDPEGNLWEELSPEYQARKPKNQDKVLVLSGDLMDSLDYDESPTALLFGTNLIYGATHQFGRPDDHIPERPFLGISGADEDEILTILHRHLANPRT